MDVRHDEGLKEPVSSGIWPEESLARVPYWVYQDEANYKREMERLFEAATWNFVCLEADIPNKGDYRTNQLGDMPVIVVRDADGSINCFENRCAHRGASLEYGRVEERGLRCKALEVRQRQTYCVSRDTYRAFLLINSRKRN